MKTASAVASAWEVKHPRLAAIRKRRNLIAILLLLLAGMFSIGKGVELSHWRDPQSEFYNLGVEAYMQGDCPTAEAFFDQSVAAYEQALLRDNLNQSIYGQASLELAALSYFQKGKCLLLEKKARPAIEALMQSIRLNPGNDYSALGVSTADVQRLFDQALIVKYDLELLFQQNPSQSQQSQKGQPGQPSEKGDQPVPGSPQQPGQPANGQGDGGGDDL